MLQELYSETGAAAQAIVEEVAPAVNETTKEEIAGAAVDRAEAIADHIADTVKLEQSEHTAIVEACSQVIYAEALAELADNAKITALENLFTEEYVQNFYAELEAKNQETYGEKTEKVKQFLGNNKKNAGIGAAAGAGVGAISGVITARKAAKAKGLQPGTPEYKKFIAKRTGVATAAGATVGAGAGLGFKSAKAGATKLFKKTPKAE